MSHRDDLEAGRAADADRFPLPLALVTADGSVRHLNAPLLELIRPATAAPARGRLLSDLLPALPHAALDDALAAAGRGVQVVGRRAAGPGRTWALTVFPADPAGSLYGVLVQDLTLQLAVEAGDALRRQRASILADATLSVGSSLDEDEVVREVEAVLIPAVADAVNLLLTPPDDGPPLPVQLPEPLRRVLRGQGPILAASVGPEQLGELTEAPERAQELRRRGAHSVVCVPLVSRGRVAGLLTAWAGPHRQPFGVDDLALLEDVAVPVSAAVQRCRAYGRQRARAVALQRALLPGALPELAAAEVAVRYLPGRGEEMVGGDWFDVIPGPAGRVVLAIGDVMGHGVKAAAAMGQVRTALRTIAAGDPRPGQALRALAEVVDELDVVPFATCLYAVYDPAGRRLLVASAGHLPAALIGPGGQVELLEVPVGVPLGSPVERPGRRSRGPEPGESSIAVADGSVLVLYTDGLVERRKESLDTGLRMLRRSLRAPAGSLEERCEALLVDLVPHGADDDVALLVAGLRGLPAARVTSWTAGPDPAAAAGCRARLRALAAGWRIEAELDDAELLLSELAGNAVRHAEGPFEVRLTRLPGALACEVRDGEPVEPWPRELSGDAVGGRGLQVLDALAERWGVRRERDGKTVWFELVTRERLEPEVPDARN